MRCRAVIQVLCNLATLQTVSFGGGGTGAQLSQGGVAPSHPLEPPLLSVYFNTYIL